MSEDEGDPRQYEQGYLWIEEIPGGIPEIPDDAWGKPLNGLQAALTVPSTIRLNEVAMGYVVIRNVSGRTIRLTHPRHIEVLGFTGASTPRTPRGQIGHWELKPGHQIAIPLPPIQVIAAGDIGRIRAFTRVTPGPHSLYAYVATVNANDYWPVTGVDGTIRKISPRKDEWTGMLTMPRQPIQVLGEKVPFHITPPKCLPSDHGLSYVAGRPPSISREHTAWIEMGEGLKIAIDSSQDAHWLVDYGTYSRSISWGPIPSSRLKDLKLLERLRRQAFPLMKEIPHEGKLSKEYWPAKHHNRYMSLRIRALVESGQPLAEMGLQFIPSMKLPGPELTVPPDDLLVRAIRDRRVELERLGLGLPMERALEVLSADAAPMPDESLFEIIADTQVPQGLEDEAWGPANAGLQAAALMPDRLIPDVPSNVRLFIRNVSDHDIRFAVSDLAGYDYATAVDTNGNVLETVRPWVDPIAFRIMGGYESYPGQFRPKPTLQNILLRSGAIFELATKSSLCFHLPKTKTAPSYVLPEHGAIAVTHVTAEPMAARVTWHLHTANGTAYSKDWKRRIWPAKGAWAGVLTTAPTEISLHPDQSETP
ncbi:MAG: hypothetical protein NXI04_18485 [Planctomycetaceae bacterium]|nr:hypothetical protein [Planctomycetaceae bacterium]